MQNILYFYDNLIIIVRSLKMIITFTDSSILGTVLYRSIKGEVNFVMTEAGEGKNSGNIVIFRNK
jgi:hypothetical protein